MKKIRSAIILAVLALTANAQNFNKGSMSADAQVGVDIYDTEYTTHYKFNNLDTTIVSTDKAGCKSFSFAFEYEIINRLGLGVRLKFNNYFTSYDSTTNSRPVAVSQDYMFTVNYHLLDKDKFDLSGGVSFGGSHLKYTTKNSSGDIITGFGPYVQFQLNPRFIIKKSVGLGLSVYSPIVNYSKMTTNNANANQYALTKWKGSGYGVSLGFTYLISTK